jgi:enoyl-CoA hydratase/carnithine racemase
MIHRFVLPRRPSTGIVTPDIAHRTSDIAHPASGDRRDETAGMSDEPEVLYDVDGAVATVTLNRPHRRNAISMRMLGELGDAFERAEADRQVRAVVVTGAGKGFCSGLDIKDAFAGTGIGGDATGGGAGGGAGGVGALRTRHLPTVVLHQMDTPVIAAVNGAAAGYGLDLALGCDIRLLGASARLMPGFAKRGVVPESGGTWYLTRLVGWAKAAEIGFLGRDIDAGGAKELGLANDVVADDDLLSTARGWAGEIAANAPLAVQAMKRLFRHGLTEDFESHTHHVLLQTMQLFGSEDFEEGLMSFVEQRPPRFEGR